MKIPKYKIGQEVRALNKFYLTRDFFFTYIVQKIFVNPLGFVYMLRLKGSEIEDFFIKEEDIYLEYSEQ